MSRFYADEKYYAVRDAVSSLGWELVESEKAQCELLWTNLKAISFDERNYRFVNHFSGSQVFSNKAFFAYNMMQKGFTRYIPTTWEFGSQTLTKLVQLVTQSEIELYTSNESRKAAFVGEMKNLSSYLRKVCGPRNHPNHNSALLEVVQMIEDIVEQRNSPPTATTIQDLVGNIWIVKPIGLSCGESIKVCQGLKHVLETLLVFEGRCVIQKYIEKPLLVRGGHKFDIRQWVLIRSLNPLVIHGFSEFYVRLSSVPFSTSKADLENPLVHLTNFAIQKNASSDTASFVSESDSVCELMMTEKEFQAEISARYSAAAFQQLKQQIQKVSMKGIQSGISHLQDNEGSFEWLGLDLMVDEDLNVVLIEMNTSPDISYSTPVTTRLVKAAMQQLIPLITNTTVHVSTNDQQSRSSLQGVSTVEEETLHWCPWTNTNDEEIQNEQSTDALMIDIASINPNVYWKKSKLPPFLETASIIVSNWTSMLEHNSEKKTAGDADSEDEI